MTLTYIDFFSGAGGWSCGFKMAGLKHIGAYDFNESACRTAKYNISKNVNCVDLNSFDARTILDCNVDIVVGSPPCQGFSNEGYKNEKDPRNSLVWKFFDFIEILSPKVWIFENVPGFKTSYKGIYFKQLQQRLELMPAYHWNYFILNSSDYGVPQKRSRFFAIGAKNFQPERPEATHSNLGEVLGTDKAISLWEAISDLPKIGIGEKKGIFEYDQPAECEYQKWARLGSNIIKNHTSQNHSQRVLEKIKSVPLGSGMEVFVNKYQENKVVYCGGYRRAVKDEPSYTAYWTRGMTSIHPEEHRFLSPRECARIQSFPDSFIFQGTTIENYTQICNAVPPLVARSFARYLLKVLKGIDIPAIPWNSTKTVENNDKNILLKSNDVLEKQNYLQLKLPV